MDRPVLASNPTDPVPEHAAIPDCNLYNREGLPASPSGFLMTTAKVSTNNCGFPLFGTRSVQLSERKRGTLLPKRHQIKHLEFVVSWFGTRGSEVQILSPRPSFLSLFQSFTLLRLFQLFRYISGHSVQLRATRSRNHTVLPTFCGMRRPL